jgi:hypothetical protein
MVERFLYLPTSSTAARRWLFRVVLHGLRPDVVLDLSLSLLLGHAITFLDSSDAAQSYGRQRLGSNT